MVTSTMARATQPAVAIILLVLFGGGCEQQQSAVERTRRATTREFAPDIVRGKALCSLINEVFTANGRVLDSLDAVERSAYYPFRTSYRQTSHQGCFRISIPGSPGNGIAVLVEQQSGGSLRKEWSCSLTASSDPKNRTSRRLRYWTSGRRRIRAFILDEREALRRATDYARELHAERTERPFPLLEPKPIPALGIASDLPETPAELRLYLQWLQQVEGTEGLIDAWGREVSFRVQRGRITAKSLGPDGVVGSSDDIDLVRPLR
jgi:hypothetical protein